MTGPDDFGGTDEGSHYCAQDRVRTAAPITRLYVPERQRLAAAAEAARLRRQRARRDTLEGLRRVYSREVFVDVAMWAEQLRAAYKAEWFPGDPHL